MTQNLDFGEKKTSKNINLIENLRLDNTGHTPNYNKY